MPPSHTGRPPAVQPPDPSSWCVDARARVEVAEIDPTLTDTEAMSEAYGFSLAESVLDLAI